MSEQPQWVTDSLEELAKHFKQPVRLVSEYCDALYTWLDVVRKEHGEDAGPQFQDVRHPWSKLLEAEGTVRLAIEKSCLLNRLIYMGQKLRSEKCPIHKGRWSGYGHCHNDPPCHIAPGYDITGWLPEEGDEPPEMEVWVDLQTGEKTEVDWRKGERFGDQ